MHTLGVCILDAYPLQPSSPSCRAAPKRYVGLPQNVLPTLTLTVMPDFSSLKRRAGLPKNVVPDLIRHLVQVSTILPRDYWL